MVGGIQISPSGACQSLSKSVHFGHRAGGSPLSPPGEISVPRRSQTVIMVLEYPPNTLPRLGTVPDSLGDLERAGEREKLKIVDFLAKSWIWSEFGGFESDLEYFHQILLDFEGKITPERPGPLPNTLNHCCGTCTGPWEVWEGPGPVKTRFPMRFDRFPKFREVCQMRIPNKAVHYCTSICP